LTVLVAAMLMISGVNISAPGSLLSTAISADASSTTLLTFGGLAPFSNQFIHQGGTGLDIFPDQSLGALNSAFHGRNPQFVALHAQNHFVSGLDPKRFPIRSGNDDASVLVDARAGFNIHRHTPNYMTLLYHNDINDTR